VDVMAGIRSSLNCSYCSWHTTIKLMHAQFLSHERMK